MLERCGEKGTLLHCWWECKLVQPPWRIVCRFFKKTENRTTIWSSNPTLGHIAKENHSAKTYFIPIFTVPGGSVIKNLPANAGDTRDVGLTPRSGTPLGGENGKPLQYSCWDNPMDRGDWQATVHGVTKNWTWLSNWTHAHTHTHTQHTHYFIAVLITIARRIIPEILQTSECSHSLWWAPRKLRMWKTGYWPRIAEMHMKGMVSVSPDSCIFPYIEKHCIS